MKRSTHHLLAAVLAGLFGLFLIYGSLTSSDFPRGLYEPPMTTNAAVWDSFAALNQNRVWHYGLGGYSILADYMNLIHNHGMKAVLRRAGGPFYGSTYYLEHYSYGQYDHHEAEWDYQTSYIGLFVNSLPEYYYHFWHGGSADTVRGARVQYQPPGGGLLEAWKCTKATDSQGIVLYGPCETHLGEDSLGLDRNQTDCPEYNGTRPFKAIFRVMANTSQLQNLSDPVFTVKVQRHNTLGAYNWTIAETTFTGQAFADTSYPYFKNLEMNYLSPDNSTARGWFSVCYKIIWHDNCDFWVDWIDYMDMERGYYLFYNADLKDSILTRMAAQCDSIEDDWAADMAGWGQSDEPLRQTFRAHGIVNDLARTSLTRMPLTPLRQDFWQRRPDLFVQFAKPPLVDTDPYVFKGDSSYGLPGSQQELDTLARHLEDAYQACQIDQDSSIEMHFTGQAFSKWNSASSQYTSRHPTAAEIRVETGIALAHGAKGISFFTYRSSYNSTTGDSILGLVNLQGLHPAGTIYDEKWLAVQEVFTQLDAIGDTLLLLERDAAFCVAQAPNFQGAVDNIYFEEADDDYIEVGQFHLPPSNSPDYLIIVNRRTNGDRHITVETNLDSTNVLRDIYTQEQFVSSTGDFKAIPFEAGEGRIFKLEAFNDWIWSNNDDHIVLADTVTNTTETPNEIWVNEGPARATTPIYATKYGFLKFGEDQTLDCHGLSTDSAVFTALEPEEGWLGLYFENSGTTSGRDSLVYTRVEHTSGPAIRAYDGSYLYLKNSWIKSAAGAGLLCDGSDLILESSSITNCSSHGLVLVNSGAKIYNDSICYNGNNGPSGIFAVSGSVLKIGDTHLSYNNDIGISCMSAAALPIMLRSSAYPQCGRNSVMENRTDGIYATGGGFPYLGLDSTRQGLNSIYSNGVYDVLNSNPSIIIPAQYNWWGQYPPLPSQFYGLVLAANALPNPPGDSFFGGSSPPPPNPTRGSDGLLPGNTNLTEANRLNNVAVELFLDGEYYAAIDTFDLVVNQFPGTSPARFALNHLVVCYREADDYAGAVSYLNDFLQPPTDPTLVSLALYHKVLNLARLQEYPAAIAIAGNAQLMGTMPQDLQEPLLIELGMMQKYGMQNVVVGNGVFEQFLLQFPESPLAPIAAMELGIAWESRGTSGSGAQDGITAVDLPAEFRLYPNHPNPFNPTTTITFGLPVASWVKVEVFDIAGRLIGLSGSGATPTTGYLTAGVHGVTFDGSDLPSGIYLVRFQAGDFNAVEKMVLLK